MTGYLKNEYLCQQLIQILDILFLTPIKGKTGDTRQTTARPQTVKGKAGKRDGKFKTFSMTIVTEDDLHPGY